MFIMSTRLECKSVLSTTKISHEGKHSGGLFTKEQIVIHLDFIKHEVNKNR